MKTKHSGNWINTAKGETLRIEANFVGFAFAPHRHDTYTLALTTTGVQCFNYRGSLRYSLPGKVVVLHPDELHDGLAGTVAPFGYRAINIDPVDVQNILHGHDLPFLPNGVTGKSCLVDIAQRFLTEFQRPLEPLEYQDLIYDFATALQKETTIHHKHTTANYQAIQLAREYIDDSLDNEVTLEQLAIITGYSKWQITRDFRSLFGTSPYRYLTLRRLEKAQSLMSQGIPIAQVAQDCFFSDQSHFTRQFKKSFGTTPNIWNKLNGNLPTAKKNES
jgi:AraC-like DNA-binding protein